MAFVTIFQLVYYSVVPVGLKINEVKPFHKKLEKDAYLYPIGSFSCILCTRDKEVKNQSGEKIKELDILMKALIT